MISTFFNDLGSLAKSMTNGQSMAGFNTPEFKAEFDAHFENWLKFVCDDSYRNQFIVELIKEGENAPYWKRAFVKNFNLDIVQDILKLNQDVEI